MCQKGRYERATEEENPKCTLTDYLDNYFDTLLLSFFTGNVSGEGKEWNAQERQGMGGFGRWMHWGLKKGEDRNQGCYK